ncbi:MAG: hypothetical protein ACP5JE_04710, partial [Thermoplasmata archaeon]
DGYNPYNSYFVILINRNFNNALQAATLPPNLIDAIVEVKQSIPNFSLFDLKNGWDIIVHATKVDDERRYTYKVTPYKQIPINPDEFANKELPSFESVLANKKIPNWFKIKNPFQK